MAIAATGEYTAAQGGTVASALSAITTTINGVNAIYAQEISVRLTLIGNENSIIYTDGTTDPYTSGNLNSLIGENQSNLQSVIGDDNYDLGQVFDGPNVGGLANIGGVCDNARKGKGASTGNFVDITAHELGHQLGAHHIFNSTSGFCGNFNGGSQRNGPTAYEVGSGSTLMSYAGGCSPEDLQLGRDNYFNGENLIELDLHLAGSCDAESDTGNRAPGFQPLPGPVIDIPSRTPFTLTATGANDPDGDAITYTWEEDDMGTASPPEGDDGSRPLFRPIAPAPLPANTSTFSRTFPQLQYILANANNPPATYVCASDAVGNPINCLTGETLPTTTRFLRFRATVRDNRGGIGQGIVDLQSHAAAGPFVVTDPNPRPCGPLGCGEVV